MVMGERGMAEHQDHAGHMEGPENTLPMMMGKGPHGNIEMGGMFTVLKVRDGLAGYDDPGWYHFPEGSVARRVDAGERPQSPEQMDDMPGMSGQKHDG
jgi:hypothetical protein